MSGSPLARFASISFEVAAIVWKRAGIGWFADAGFKDPKPWIPV